MPLEPGTRFGPYEILAPIGAGGMGEVYKARDTRLERTVAVKVLPEHIARRPDLQARFEREAQAVASLNHPNICTLHDIGSQGGQGYMVMEYLDGETLAARIAKGALPLDEALKYAVQIADALARAHQAGVTHRDVKPQNIMLTRDGAKVLDFGLAKTHAPTKIGSDDATLTAGLTLEGTVLGTPQYMAPELFSGAESDARGDIWAFGAVLYEMASGTKAFEGKDYRSLVGAILSAEPPPMALKPITPAWLERLTRRCLAKNPERRYFSMHDIVLDLSSPPAEPVTAKARRWPWVVAGAIAVVSGALMAGWARPPSPQAPAWASAYRFQLNPPENGQFDVGRGFAISPDGRTLAFVANAPGKSGLWLRSIDGAARLLPGPQEPSDPFWSPDGRSVAYQGHNQLWRVDVAEGSHFAICDLGSGYLGGTWMPDDAIVYSDHTGLHRVPAAGGASVPLTKLEAGRGETAHRWPQALPGGRILFQVEGNPERAGIYVLSLAQPQERIRLVTAGGNGLYAAGYLLWLRGSRLVAQRLDLEHLKLSGEPLAIADPVGAGGYTRVSATASSNGLLVYGRAGRSQLTWLDSTGKPAHGRSALGQPDDYFTFRLSPDGRRIAIGRASGSGRDLLMVDVKRDAWSRFTFLPGLTGFPVWSPDGRTVIFRGGSPSNVYRKEVSGTGAEHRVLESASVAQSPADWSRDGRLLLYHRTTQQTGQDLWVMPVTPDGKPDTEALAKLGPRPYLQTTFNERHGRFSPEPGPRWVAYMSDESGRDEIYMQAFPEPRGKFQISTGGGSFPEWSPNGQELYYVAPDSKLMAVGLKLGSGSVALSTPRELFALPSVSLGASAFAVAPDGKGFLVLAPASGSPPLEVIVNWPALMKAGGGE